MSNHEIAARAHHWVIATLAGVIMLSLLAQSQRKDAADDQAVRAQVAKQARAASQPDTWAKLVKK